MTFWGFFEIVMTRVKCFVTLPGTWPFGVFARDPTEALIQYGTARASFSVKGTEAEVDVRVPGNAERTIRVEMSSESAASLGDEIGHLLANQRDEIFCAIYGDRAKICRFLLKANGEDYTVTSAVFHTDSLPP